VAAEVSDNIFPHIACKKANKITKGIAMHGTRAA